MDGGPLSARRSIESVNPSFSGSLSCPRSIAESPRGGEAMEAAPSAKPRREPPPIPPNYVSLQQLRKLRLKEKEEEEEEKRRREAEEAAAAKRAAALKAEEVAMAAAVKREEALKAETKGRIVSRGAFRGAKERHRGGQGYQWVAVAHRAPATTPRPTPTFGAAREKEWMEGGNRGKKGPDDVADNAPHPHGGCKSPWKGKGKKKASSCQTVGEPGNLSEEVAPAASNGGKPENKSEIKAMGKASVAALDPSKAAVASSPGHLTCKGRKGAGGRTAETSPGDAPTKTAGPSPPRGVKSGNTGKPKPAAPRLADAGIGIDSPEGKEAAPVQAPPTSAADDSSKQKTVEANPEGRVEGQRRQPPWVARRSAEPWRRRGNGAAEPHGCVWVPKAKAAAVGSSTGAGDK